ncbi:hypothetical protein KAW50_08350 [candidate division WOR-3 bacterium]|nr:hypothetical protein [candidate division WOR-3 bacterium]
MKKQTEPKDERLQRASAIQGLLNHKGYKILKKEWEKVKEQAFNDLIDETLPDSNLSQRRYVYNQICEWIDLPNLIIGEGETAVAESKEPQPKESFVKRAVQFMGRKY